MPADLADLPRHEKVTFGMISPDNLGAVRLHAKQLVRFVGVGVLSSIVYALAVVGYVEFLDVGARWASICGYLTSLPVNFFGHRIVTFCSEGRLTREFGRFLLLHGTNILVSVAGMSWAVDWGYSYWVGIVLAVVFIPVSSYLVMHLWIFRRRTPEP